MNYYSSIILADNPLSYWQLNETSGTSAADSGTGGNTGTYTGGFTLNQPGPGAGSGSGLLGVLLNGTTGCVDCGPASNLNLERNFSIEAWVKTAASSGNFGIMSHGTGGWYMRVNNGKLDLLVSGTVDVQVGNAAIADNAWHHVVITIDTGGFVRMYVDGALDVTNSTEPTFGSSQHVTLGRDTNSGGTATEFWSGALSNAAVYNSVLSATRVAAHYNGLIPPPSGSLAAALLMVPH